MFDLSWLRGDPTVSNIDSDPTMKFLDIIGDICPIGRGNQVIDTLYVALLFFVFLGALRELGVGAYLRGFFGEYDLGCWHGINRKTKPKGNG